MLAWFQAAGFSLGSFLGQLRRALLLLPLISLALSSVFGFLLHLISARVRNLQSLTTVCAVAAGLPGGVFPVAISRMNIWITNLAADPTPLAHAIGGVAPLVWLGRACVGGDLLALGALALLTAALLLLIWVALERSFVKTATAKSSIAKVKYVEKAVDAVSPDRALLRREPNACRSPPTSSTGCPRRHHGPDRGGLSDHQAQKPRAAAVHARPRRFLPLLLLLGLCFMSSMCTLPRRASLEGKSLWLRSPWYTALGAACQAQDAPC